jgi:hypothetical protein
MKFFLFLLLVGFVASAQPEPQRIHFKLKNTLGQQGYRVEGPGIAYGFTMSRGKTIEENWPIGAKLYFSTDGESRDGLILTVERSMAGQVVPIPATAKANRVPTRPTQQPDPAVEILFRNNSLRFRSVAVISYQPGETGNGTTILKVRPYGTFRQRFPVGTRVYLADEAQVQTVMSGKRLTGPPFLTVTADDKGQTFPIFK